MMIKNKDLKSAWVVYNDPKLNKKQVLVEDEKGQFVVPIKDVVFYMEDPDYR